LVSGPAAAAPSPRPPQQPVQHLAIITGISWLAGAAAISYLAFLQLQYSSVSRRAMADEVRALALWNGFSAAITVYFGAMLLMKPSRSRAIMGSIWGGASVIYGAYQVSDGVRHPAFLFALVCFGLAGVLSLVLWLQVPRPPSR